MAGLLVTTFFSGLIFLSMIVYIPLVYLNLTFTFDDLTAATIPFYTGSVNRYAFDWWIIATDVLRLVIPFYLIFITAVPIDSILRGISPNFYQNIFRVFVIIVSLVEVFKILSFLLSIAYKGSCFICTETYNCTSPGCTGGNFVFYIMLGYSIGFLVLYFIIGIGFMNSIKEYLNRQRLVFRQTYENITDYKIRGASLIPITLYGFIILVSLLIYFPLVHLNLTFTFKDLKANVNIPFYMSSLERFGIDWWIVATDVLRLVPPFYLFFMLAVPLSPIIRRTSILSYQIIDVVLYTILLFIELSKVGFFIVGLIIGSNFTRLYACYAVGCSGTNFIYLLMFAYSIAFSTFYILFGAFYRKIFIEYEYVISSNYVWSRNEWKNWRSFSIWNSSNNNKLWS